MGLFEWKLERHTQGMGQECLQSQGCFNQWPELSLSQPPRGWLGWVNIRVNEIEKQPFKNWQFQIQTVYMCMMCALRVMPHIPVREQQISPFSVFKVRVNEILLESSDAYLNPSFLPMLYTSETQDHRLLNFLYNYVMQKACLVNVQKWRPQGQLST